MVFCNVSNPYLVDVVQDVCVVSNNMEMKTDPYRTQIETMVTSEINVMLKGFASQLQHCFVTK